MAITKEKVLKSTRILENGIIEIQYANRISENGVMLAETYERTTRHISDDLDDLDDKIKQLGNHKHLYPKKVVPELITNINNIEKNK